MLPSISVIIPAFNPDRFLTDAVQSLIAQTWRDWEAVVVDDGSRESIEPLIPKDNRIVLVRQENRGSSAARNTGIRHSRGELVAFLDADDIWEPTKLERQFLQLQERPHVVLAHSQMRLIDENGRSGGLGWGGGYTTYSELLDGCGVCTSSVVMRRDILFACGLFDSMLKIAHDYDLWLKATRLRPDGC